MENQIEKNIEHLRNSQLFHGFTDDEIEKFLYNTKFKIFELNRGAILNVELDKSIFVLYGSIASYETNIDGVKTFINHFEPDGNELIAISLDTPYPTVSVEARKKSVVLSLETNSFLITDPSIIFYKTEFSKTLSVFFTEWQKMLCSA